MFSSFFFFFSFSLQLVVEFMWLIRYSSARAKRAYSFRTPAQPHSQVHSRSSGDPWVRERRSERKRRETDFVFVFLLLGSAFSNFPPAQQQQYLHPSQPGIIAGPNTYVPPPVALNIQLPASDEAAAAQTRSASSATTASAADLEAFRAPAFAFGKIPEVEPPPEFRA